jgi:hypothetical protein
MEKSGSSTTKDFEIRWTNDDREARLPQRFAEALRDIGAARGKVIRALILAWTEEVERGGTHVERAVATEKRRCQRTKQRRKRARQQPPRA